MDELIAEIRTDRDTRWRPGCQRTATQSISSTSHIAAYDVKRVTRNADAWVAAAQRTLPSIMLASAR
jgi:hypothetical protein